MRDELTAPTLIAVANDTLAQLTLANQLAAQLQLPRVEKHSTDYRFLLLQTADQLILLQPSTQQQLTIDFLNPTTSYRRRQGGRELLARACRVKGKFPLTIIDATAGLGRDAFILANQGHHIILLERSPFVAALLADGLARLHQQHPQLAEHMQLQQQDANYYLMQQRNCVDVVYLDPLFPERHKTALVKKPMQLLQQLLATDIAADNTTLLAAARYAARHRVVVKRPRLAPPLAQQPADIQIPGTSCRFDVYLC